MPRRLALTVVAAVVLASTGCAGTRVGQLGLLANREPLVTVIVSQDRKVVERECDRGLSLAPILGCQISRPVSTPDGHTARLIKIVRYTDSLPSSFAFEIEVHELCHAVAALQSINDPCHAGNDGRLHAAAPRVLR